MAVILIADDDEAVRMLVTLILKSAGHEVVTANNGLEEVSLFRSNPDAFDLVITDITMPVMDGKQAIRLIRQTRPASRIIAMSGYSDVDLPAGTAFLRKPFTADALRSQVDEALGRSNRLG